MYLILKYSAIVLATERTISVMKVYNRNLSACGEARVLFKIIPTMKKSKLAMAMTLIHAIGEICTKSIKPLLNDRAR